MPSFRRACVSGPAPALRGVAGFCVLAALLWAATGCAREQKPERFGGAVLIGQVRLDPDAGMPEYAPADLARSPLFPRGETAPAGCADANERARRPVERTADGLLSGIVVAASDFTHSVLGKGRKVARHRVTIRGCRLEPAVIAARDGDWLMIENRDDFAFAPLMGPSLRAGKLVKGQRAEVPLRAANVASLVCTPDAPCGRSDVVVFHHPAFAVSDASGRFRIPAFPDSELVRVTAWHPLFEPSENFVWVDAGGTGRLELVLKPKQRFLPRKP